MEERKMISVEVKLHSAITGKTTLLARMFLWNRGDGDAKKGNYTALVVRKDKIDLPFHEVLHNKKAQARTGEVLNYPRMSYNVWRLITRALKSAFPEEK